LVGQPMVLGESASALPSDLAHTVIQAGVTFLIDVLARADVRARVCWIGTCAFSSLIVIFAWAAFLCSYHAHQPVVFTHGTFSRRSQNNDAVADIAGCLCRAFGKHVASAAAFLQGLQRDLGTLTDLLLVCGNEKVN
jgi:hypothetical protein